MANSLKNHIENLLKTDERLIDENNEIRGSLIRELANKLDEKLIELLLNDQKSQDSFFLNIKGVFVFKYNDFKFFLDENKIDNSYTQYENRIGLAVGSKMLNENHEVVLNFPYKDCVLEGGQSTEEGMDTYFEFNTEKIEYEEKQSKRKEIFFNEVLARDEIDRLFEPKAFSNIKKYSQKGEEIPLRFERDENGVIKDNLIIKGNNLLALHSLKKQFKGKVKLIYIDPPYNRDADSFYNDNFKNSTWLTFMKNRLEIAKEMLTPDGFFFVQIDDYQLGYLKIICDEVFFRENAVNIIAVKMSETSGVKMAHVDKKLPKIKEFVLSYKKSDSSRLNPLKILKESQENKLDEYLKYYRKAIENYDDPINQWKISSIKDILLRQGKIANDDNIKEFQLLNAERVVYRTNNKSFAKLKIDAKFALVKSKQGLDYVWWEGKQMLFLADYIDEYICDFWTDISTINLNKEGGVDLANGKKPEKLIKRIIELTTKKGDIVMDYHLGSGTTAAVSTKLNRKFIGIEQLDYNENDSIIRLKNVINGDISGISTDADIKWKGGGSFVYLELAKNNEQAKELILDCNNFQELLCLFDVLYDEFFLHYNVRIKEFKEKVCEEEAFKNLPLLKQKEMFCKMLDLNQMYVNLSEIEDSRYKLSDNDKSLTKDFYQIKN